MSKTNPLDAFASTTVPGNLKLPPMPNLGELISSLGFKQGHAKYHEAMTEWAQNLEQTLSERLQTKAAIPTGKVD